MTDYLDALLDLEAAWQATEENALEAVLTALGRTEPAGGREPGHWNRGEAERRKTASRRERKRFFGKTRTRRRSGPLRETGQRKPGPESWPGRSSEHRRRRGRPWPEPAETVQRRRTDRVRMGPADAGGKGGRLRSVRPAPAGGTGGIPAGPGRADGAGTGGEPGSPDAGPGEPGPAVSAGRPAVRRRAVLY